MPLCIYCLTKKLIFNYVLMFLDNTCECKKCVAYHT